MGKWGYGTYKTINPMYEIEEEVYGNYYIAEELNPFEFFPDFLCIRKSELEAWCKAKRDWEEKHQYSVIMHSIEKGKETVQIFNSRTEAFNLCKTLNELNNNESIKYTLKEIPKIEK